MKVELKENLNLLDVFCIATGAMISSGLFLLPGVAFAKAGPAVIVSYVLAGLFCIPTMLSISELSTAMPKAGGGYFYIMRGFGPLFGTIAGLSMWFSLSLKGAFALLGMGTYLSLFTNIPLEVIAVICCLFFIILNLVSVKDAGRIQVVIVIGMLAILLLYVIWGMGSVQMTNISPMFTKGVPPVFATASFVFVSYGGLVKVVALAEETKNPARTLPLGMILSLIISAITYTLVVFVTVGVSEPGALERTLIPISDGAGVFGNELLKILISIAAFFAFISTANSSIMTASRYPLGMSRDKLLPAVFQKISARFGTPYISIILTGLFMIAFVLFLPLVSLVKVASSLLLLIFIFANLTVILFRESKIHSYKPKFYSPLYPYIQVIGILGGGFLLIEMGSFIVFMTTLFIFLGFLWYVFYVRKRVKKDSALIYALERLIAKDKALISDNILNELKDIVIARDDVVRDKFHDLIEECEVLDIDAPMARDDFFNDASAILGEKLNMNPDDLRDMLIARENEASTVMRKGLAIPHVIIEGENIFEILIARAKTGVIFPDDKLAHIIFVTVGSNDNRNLHLKVLAAIAQITQNPEFDEKWLEVTNKEELKHIVLLAERKRY